MSKVILTGATGTAGSEVLLQLVSHPSVSQVSVLSRCPLPQEMLDALPASKSKLQVIQMEDFEKYTPEVMEKLAGHSSVIWTLGISSLLVSKEEYHKLTYDYAAAAAEAFAPLSPDFKFVFISGYSTSAYNPSLGMRVKAATETKIASILGSSRAFFFRPAFIYPPTRLPGLRPRASAELTADKWASTLERWAGPSM
ncbi:hypothetical protein BDY24DRAFT_398970, partial [Mrakia frigida]|uniref:uncharacterized protein n=1 Tax=Mrakia frigida TaxID=29902 RepID=UPI003FCC171F